MVKLSLIIILLSLLEFYLGKFIKIKQIHLNSSKISNLHIFGANYSYLDTSLNYFLSNIDSEAISKYSNLEMSQIFQVKLQSILGRNLNNVIKYNTLTKNNQINYTLNISQKPILASTLSKDIIYLSNNKLKILKYSSINLSSQLFPLENISYSNISTLKCTQLFCLIYYNNYQFHIFNSILIQKYKLKSLTGKITFSLITQLSTVIYLIQQYGNQTIQIHKFNVSMSPSILLTRLGYLKFEIVINNKVGGDIIKQMSVNQQNEALLLLFNGSYINIDLLTGIYDNNLYPSTIQQKISYSSIGYVNDTTYVVFSQFYILQIYSNLTNYNLNNTNLTQNSSLENITKTSNITDQTNITNSTDLDINSNFDPNIIDNSTINKTENHQNENKSNTKTDDNNVNNTSIKTITNSSSLTIIKNIISIPNVRRLIYVINPLFLFIQDFWFYSYHNRNYSESMQSVFETIRILNSAKLFPQIILETINQVKQKISIKNSKLHRSNFTLLTSIKFYENQGQQIFFISNTQDVIIWNFFFSFLTFLIIKFLYYTPLTRISLFKYYLKQNSKWSMLTLSCVQGNLQYFVFMASNQLLTFISYQWFDKFNLIIMVVILWIIIFYSICSYLLVWRFYRNDENFFDNKPKKLGTCILNSANLIFRNLLIGFIHGYLINNPSLQTILIIAIDALSLLSIIFGNNYFNSKVSKILLFTYYLSRIIIDIFVLNELWIRIDKIPIVKIQQYTVTIALVIVVCQFFWEIILQIKPILCPSLQETIQLKKIELFEQKIKQIEMKKQKKSASQIKSSKTIKSQSILSKNIKMESRNFSTKDKTQKSIKSIKSNVITEQPSDNISAFYQISKKVKINQQYIKPKKALTITLRYKKTRDDKNKNHMKIVTNDQI